MKTSAWILTVVMAATLALTGCSKQGGGGGDTAASVDTSALESKFQSAEPTAKSSADKAVAAIKAADYPTALSELKKLAEDAKLTPEQQQAVKDVMAQVEKAITGAASKAADDASKAVGDAAKSLPIKQ